MVKMSNMVVMCVLYEKFYVVYTTLTIHYQGLEPSGLCSALDADVNLPDSIAYK